MNKRLQLAVRKAACELCRMHTQAEGRDRCVTGQGPNDADVVVVTKMPVSDSSRTKAELEDYFREVGIDSSRIMWCSAIKCRVWDLDPSKGDLKKCAPYLRQELKFINPKFVLTLGAEAWFAASGWADIMKWRGQLVDSPDCDAVIFPTISPSAVARNPGLRGGFIADLSYFKRLINDQEGTDPYHTPGPDRVTYVGTKTALRDMLRAFRRSSVVAYDIESGSASGGFCPEYDPEAVIVSICFTTAGEDMSDAHVWQVPLFHPESPWRRVWQEVIRIIGKTFRRIPKRVAHNAKYDTKWLRQFGIPDLTPTFDTIVAAALLDENRPKGLKPLAQMLLGADPWGIDTKDLLNTPLSEVLEYNGLDTWHDLRLYFLFRKQLKEQPRLGRLFLHLMMPAIQELISVEQRGVYVDKAQLAKSAKIVRDTLGDIERRLSEYLPKDKNEIPDEFFDRHGNLKVNFNASNFARWWLFEYLEMPIIARGKAKDDGSPGNPSMAESVMMELAEIHPVGKLMLDRVKWNKFETSFIRPYENQLDNSSRIHTTFKPWGTVTGRLSSGKEDQEKITVGRRNAIGVNLQQVPREKLIRGVFGAPPGWLFIEGDYSQIELRIAAHLAQEPTMLHLYATGQDIHMAMAMRMTGKPRDQITPEERKRAKAVNFGFLYGMGWAKFIMTAWENYSLRVSEEDSKAFRKSFFEEFSGLPKWHARQRALAHKYGRVETPMGRVRHLPDIYSPMPEVRAEAERQAINSPVQALASDMALLSLVHTARRFRAEGIEAYPIGTVHDAVNFEVHESDVHKALPIIKDTMEHLPLERLFNLTLSVPIVADLKVGKHWGGATEVPAELVYEPTDLRKWTKEVIAA